MKIRLKMLYDQENINNHHFYSSFESHISIISTTLETYTLNKKQTQLPLKLLTNEIFTLRQV